MSNIASGQQVTGTTASGQKVTGTAAGSNGSEIVVHDSGKPSKTYYIPQ